MAEGIREKYELKVAAPEGINLLDARTVDAYIRKHILDRIAEYEIEFVNEHSVDPQEIRVPGDVYTHVKGALETVTERPYIPDSDVKVNGVPVTSSCKYVGHTIVMEYWEQ